MAVDHEMNRDTNFFVAGVGGQGAMLASDIIAEVGIEAGLDVKKSEIHGMAQRAGSVYSHVRWGRKVYAPAFAEGEADYLLAFEVAEALRWQQMLKPSGIAIVNLRKIMPVAVALGTQPYPSDDLLLAEFSAAGQTVLTIAADDKAKELGNVRVANSIVLGVLARLLYVDDAIWLSVLSRRVPSNAVEKNLAAFQVGMALVDSASIKISS